MKTITELRHIDEIKGNFGIADSQYIPLVQYPHNQGLHLNLL
jgi:hypothetical protein